MKRKGKNSEKKEKKEINGRFTHKLSRQGFFAMAVLACEQQMHFQSWLLYFRRERTRSPELKILGPFCNQTVNLKT